MPRDRCRGRRRAIGAGPPGRPAAQAGFGLLDVLFALLLLALGLLSQSAGAVSEHNLARAQVDRTRAHQAIRQFVERLRADEDWPTLFGRIAVRQTATAQTAGTGFTLDDGRIAYLPTEYYADFTSPSELGTTAVRVEVPLVGAAASLPELREDLTLPGFGLPADLNADGLIDSASRNADYIALPVRVVLRWSRDGTESRELTVATWLRGER